MKGEVAAESVYRACLCRELEIRRLRFESQIPLGVDYKTFHVERAYTIDILVEGTVILEIKSVETWHPVHPAQLLTYLKLTGIRCGLLLNFNVDLPVHGIRRVLL